MPVHRQPMSRLTGIALLGILIIALVFSFPFLHRLMKANTLFEPDEIAHNFTHMHKVFPAQEVLPSAEASTLTPGSPLSLPESFTAFGKTHDTEDFLQDTGTNGLLVLQDGKLVFEQYFQGYDDQQVHISWSVAKSMISALIGIAIHEGHIKSVHDPVDRYDASLKTSGYAGVPLRDVLHMASGVRFNENYDDEQSDIVQLARRAATGGSFNAYAQQLTSEKKPGTFRHYSSYDTQVLAMVLEGATGMPLAAYMSTRLWQPLGAERSGWWLLDGEGMAMGFGGFNASLRDYARFGQLYLDNGMIAGRSVVPEQWIAESLRMDAPHLPPGERPHQANPYADSALGYGYQWWIPEDASRDFMAMGVYNQFIYVSPATRTVIVKNSANAGYTADDYIPTMQHVALFRAIAENRGH